MIPNRGAFVTGFEEQDVADMYEMRKVYEVLAFEWAIERIYAGGTGGKSATSTN